MYQDLMTCNSNLEQETCLSSDEVQVLDDEQVSDEEQVDHPPQEAILVVSVPPQPSASDNVSSEVPNDIGFIITPSKSINDVCKSMKTMNNVENILYHSHGCNRKFTVEWLVKYPWLNYSPKLDAVFWGPCAG